MVNVKSLEEFKDIIYQNKDVVVVFSTYWCGPCKLMKPVFERVSEKFPEMVFIPVDAEAMLEISKMYNVTSVPTIIHFKNGSIYQRTTGFMSQDKFVALLTK